MKEPAPFADSLATFVAASPWLDESHEPDLTALRYLAATLDTTENRNPAPLIAQWGLILRSLRKQHPTEVESGDPLEQALRESRLI